MKKGLGHEEAETQVEVDSNSERELARETTKRNRIKTGFKEKQNRKMPAHDAMEIGAKLLKFLDYAVVASPRTGHEDLDPLLINAPDLYAEGDGKGFAINVKSPEDDFETNFDDVADLSSAAWALNKFSKEQGDGTNVTVEPVVLLVGASENPTIALHQRRGELRVLKLTQEQIELLDAAAGPENVTEILDFFRKQLEFPLRRAAS